ncbi:MAG: hypothetical protein ACKVU4_14640 [Phycisphaerales bacterium]
MVRRTHCSGVIGCALIAASARSGEPASGQETARLIIQVEPAVIAPGQSALVRVYVAYEPHVGLPAVWNTMGGSGQIGTVTGFSRATFDLSVSPAAGVSGSWSNLTLGPGSLAAGSAGTVSPSGVNGVLWGTGFGPPFVLPTVDNPVLLWFATWTADAGSGMGTLDLVTDILGYPPSYPDTVQLWLRVGAIGSFAVEDAWPCTDGQALITVIPAPGAAMVLLAGAWSIARRRRLT